MLLTFLSAVTVYRREMSCNHVYTEDDDMHTSVKDHRKVDGERSDRWEECTEELLESAGAYCSGQPLQPLFDVALSLWASICFGFLTQGKVEEKTGQWLSPSSLSSMRHKRESLQICHNTRSGALVHHSGSITRDLPADVQVHLLSFLHPKDVVSFACTSRSSLAVVDKGETSMTLWRTLWRRDYAWLVHSWSVGIDALLRSQPFPEVIDKHFYFMFGQSYVNYILAGKNSFEQCLIGLHGHIFDITAFLNIHPGSPDTLMVQSGKDATKYFEDMTHSSGARRLVQSFCVVVDDFCFKDGCGSRPTALTDASGPLVPRAVEAPTVPMARTREPSRPGTLQSIRREFVKQERLMAHRVRTRFASNPNVLSHVNTFYDPFRREWKAWYTDDQFETVYIDTI